jgi:RimJ/RimL family protein N-acetyltransferase
VSESVILHVPPADGAPGLLLRPWREQDMPALIAAYRDPVLRHWSTIAINDEADARRWLASRDEGWATGERYSFAVCEAAGKSEGDSEGSDEHLPFANVTIKALAPGKSSAEVGYWTAAQARGKGVAPRALQELTGWAFALPREKPLERLDLLHTVGNDASCRVAQKAQYAFDSVVPPLPPTFLNEGHLHIRTRLETPR